MGAAGIGPAGIMLHLHVVWLSLFPQNLPLPQNESPSKNKSKLPNQREPNYLL